MISLPEFETNLAVCVLLFIHYCCSSVTRGWIDFWGGGQTQKLELFKNYSLCSPGRIISRHQLPSPTSGLDGFRTSLVSMYIISLECRGEYRSENFLLSGIEPARGVTRRTESQLEFGLLGYQGCSQFAPLLALNGKVIFRTSEPISSQTWM